ncbi:MAG: hypothetical protein R2795_01195 [Saprospiraceae bacterium]
MYKFIANRFLTLTQNLLVNYKLSEYHTGYRAFNREVLETINYNASCYCLAGDFVFGNEMLSVIFHGFHQQRSRTNRAGSLVLISGVRQYGFGRTARIASTPLAKNGALELEIYRLKSGV